MATGGGLLTGTDPVTDELLTHVSSHVISETRTDFAIKVLGLRKTQYGHIEEDKQYASQRNIEVSCFLFSTYKYYNCVTKMTSLS